MPRDGVRSKADIGEDAMSEDTQARPAISQGNLSAWAAAWNSMGRYADRLERENASLTARVAELERDAGRYRWLRTPKVGHHQVMFWMSEPARYVSLDWNELDAAIDAARGTE